jgi:shikimate kinase
MAPLAVVVGPPGAGKSTVGRLLADLLGVPFADSDALIEAKAGKSIPDIFFDDGEPAFRAMETSTIAEALASFTGVLALGGGAILDEGTRGALAGQTVIYLSVELNDAVKRVGLVGGRPLLNVNPRATLRHLMEQRRPLYAAVATYTLATDGREPQDLAAELAALLK